MVRRVEIIKIDSATRRVTLAGKSVVTKAKWAVVKCKFCDNTDSIYRYGKTKRGTQRYLCRKCGRTFLDNGAPERMRFSSEVIASALNQFYESASLSKIQRQLQLNYGVRPDQSNIYRWITRYSKKATTELDSVPIKAGSNWMADETVLKVKGKKKGERNIWLWDIIDTKTRFLLNTHISDTRGIKDAKILMEGAAKRANDIPDTVTTDKLRSYIDGVELAFGADTEHLRSKGFKSDTNTNIIERLHGTIKDRTKVVRSFAGKRTCNTAIEGWRTHYNFFRPHQSLGGKTPAQAAGAKALYRNWRDVVGRNDGNSNKK